MCDFCSDKQQNHTGNMPGFDRTYFYGDVKFNDGLKYRYDANNPLL